jgi:hypothetical protein
MTIVRSVVLMPSLSRQLLIEFFIRFLSLKHMKIIFNNNNPLITMNEGELH